MTCIFCAPLGVTNFSNVQAESTSAFAIDRLSASRSINLEIFIPPSIEVKVSSLENNPEFLSNAGPITLSIDGTRGGYVGDSQIDIVRFSDLPGDRRLLNSATDKAILRRRHYTVANP